MGRPLTIALGYWDYKSFVNDQISDRHDVDHHGIAGADSPIPSRKGSDWTKVTRPGPNRSTRGSFAFLKGPARSSPERGSSF